jgi:hypothetical protein
VASLLAGASGIPSWAGPSRVVSLADAVTSNRASTVANLMTSPDRSSCAVTWSPLTNVPPEDPRS